MNGLVVCVAVLVAAAWLAFPAPAAGLRRLEPARPADSGLGRLLAGREGAPPLRQRVWLGVFAGVLALAWDPSRGGLGLALAACAATVGGLGWLWPRPRRDPAISQQLPGTLELLAACLEAGAPMSRAVDTVAAVSEEPTAGLLEQVGGALRIGRSESEAWATLAPDPDWGPVARDVARSARSGTSLVESFQIHAEDQRRRSEAEQAKAARKVGVRSVVPLVACFLPAFILVGVVPIIAGLLGNFLG